MSLEATCACDRCNAHLRAVRTGRDLAHVELIAAADGEIALSAGHFRRLVPEHAPRDIGTIKLSQIDRTTPRYRDHDLHCRANPRTDPNLVKTQDVRPRRRPHGR